MYNIIENNTFLNISSSSSSSSNITNVEQQVQQSSDKMKIELNREIYIYSKDDFVLNLISVIDCIIIILGTIGNLTSFYLLTRKILRPVSSMRYLAALTLVDTVCLYGWYLSSVYRQLSGEHVRRIENVNKFTCKLISYMSFTCLQLSSAILCMLTIDRLLIIKSSLWRSKYANPKFASKLVIFIAIFFCLLNLVIPITIGNKGMVQYTVKNLDDLPSTNNNNNKNNNNNNLNVLSSKVKTEANSNTNPLYNSNFGNIDLNPSNSNKMYATLRGKNFTMCYCYDDSNLLLYAWNKLHLGLYSLIPFPILSILNFLVIRMTREAARSAAQMNNNLKRFKNGQQFVTRLLLFLTISFFVTTVPSTIVYAFWHASILKYRYGRIILNLLNTLQFSRHSFNWIIYVYSSSFMREEFKKCLSCADSEYELAEAALAERPSVAIEILRQLELNNTSELDYYNIYYNQQKQLYQYDSYMDNQNSSIQPPSEVGKFAIRKNNEVNSVSNSNSQYLNPLDSKMKNPKQQNGGLLVEQDDHKKKLNKKIKFKNDDRYYSNKEDESLNDNLLDDQKKNSTTNNTNTKPLTTTTSLETK